MKININTLISYIIFIIINSLYFYFFVYTQPINDNNPLHLEYYSFFYNPTNFDYLFYFDYFVDIIKNKDWTLYVFNPNLWISFFYLRLGEVIPFSYDVLAFFINNVLFILCYYFATKILAFAKLSSQYSFLFFLNPQLIYYSQLINKEAPTLFFVLWITYLVLTNKRLLLVFAAMLAAMTRQQLLMFPLFLYFLYNAENYRWRLLHIYIVSAVVAVLFAIQSIEHDPNPFGSSGFVKFVLDMNTSYYIGNLLFSPLKVIQWIYDQLASLLFVRPEGYVDLSRVRDIGVIVVLALLGKKIVRIFLLLKTYTDRGEKILVSAFFAYVFILLINPIVHARYLFPIEVLLIMLGMGVTEKSMKTGPCRVLNEDLLLAEK